MRLFEFGVLGLGWLSRVGFWWVVVMRISGVLRTFGDFVLLAVWWVAIVCGWDGMVAVFWVCGADFLSFGFRVFWVGGVYCA